MVLQIIKNGRQYYMHAAWANSEDGDDFSLEEFAGASYRGNYLSDAVEESQDPARYVWIENLEEVDDEDEEIESGDGGEESYDGDIAILEERIEDAEASVEESDENLTAQTDSNDSVIGQVNLLTGTNQGAFGWETADGFRIEACSETIYDEETIVSFLRVTCESESIDGYISFVCDSFRDEISEVGENTYTLSCDARMSAIFLIDRIAVQNKDGTDEQIVFDSMELGSDDENVIMENEWESYQSHSISTGVAASSQVLFFSLANMKAGDTFDIANLKIENGDKATPWRQSTEEIEKVATESLKKASEAVKEVENIKAKNAEFEEVVTQEFEAVNGKIENLSGEFLSFKNGEFENLKADHAEFKEVTTEELTAAKGWMAEGSIGSAQISDLDANKIRSGTLDTSLVTVASKDSVMTITGNQLMVNDTTDALNPYNRVILGKYNKDENTIEYGLLIRSKDGQTIMLDGDGVHNAGITDGAVDNNKVADDANIEGKKLDINSVVREMNGSTELISSTIIQVGDKELNVILEEQNNTITEQSEQLTTQKSQIEANQTEISLKVDSQIYEEDKAEMTESISKATSDISVLQDQISLKVEQTDIDTAMEGLSVGARNLIRNSNTLDYIDYGFTSGSGTLNALLDAENNTLLDSSGNQIRIEGGYKSSYTGQQIDSMITEVL